MLADSPSMMRRSPTVRAPPVDGEPGACAHLCGRSTKVLSGDGSPWCAANAGEAAVSASATRLVEERRTQLPHGLLSRRRNWRMVVSPANSGALLSPSDRLALPVDLEASAPRQTCRSRNPPLSCY